MTRTRLPLIGLISLVLLPIGESHAAPPFKEHTFGFAGTVPVSADYDGDGKDDLAVYDAPAGEWYIFRSALGFIQEQFGFSGTIPVVGDYDGDGKDDKALFAPASSTWYLFRSSLGFLSTVYGYSGVVPVPGDYDGDGKTDLAVYNAPNGQWSIFRSQLGPWNPQFGFAGTVPVAADYDGDGKTDIAVYHPPSGMWYISRSSLGFIQQQFGYAGPLPAPADFDGDGKADYGLFNTNNNSRIFHTWQSTRGHYTITFPATGLPRPSDFEGDGQKKLVVYNSTQAKWFADLTFVDWDLDGLPKSWENTFSLNDQDNGSQNPNSGPGGDPDNDGLTNLQEFNLGTNPKLTDSDGDGVADGIELTKGSDPLNPSSYLVSVSGILVYSGEQTSGSFIIQAQENGGQVARSIYVAGPDFIFTDLPTLKTFTFLAFKDATGDGAYDCGEAISSSTQGIALTGPLSGLEISLVDPTPGPTCDSDADGIPDLWEQGHGLDPFSGSDAFSDQDGDGFTNLQEFQYGLDPNEANRNVQVNYTIAPITLDLELIHGDPSGSASESYRLYVDIGIPSLISGIGELVTNYKQLVSTTARYKFKLQHVASSQAPPDLDYMLNVSPVVANSRVALVWDPKRLVGTYGDREAEWFNQEDYLYLAQVNLAVDSDHDGWISYTDEPSDTEPGGFVVANSLDLEPIYCGVQLHGWQAPVLEVSLAVISGGQHIRVWNNRAKQNEISLPQTWTTEGSGMYRTYYIEGLTPGQTRLRQRITAADGTTAYDEVVINILSVDFVQMWETENKANQIFNPTKKDDKSADGYQEADSSDDTLYGIHREKLYVVSSDQNEYAVSLDLDIQPVSLRSQFVVAAYKNGTKVNGSDTPVPAQDDAQIDMTFTDPSSAAATTDFAVKAGLDANGNGTLDSGEMTFDLEVYKHPGDNQPRYATVFGINDAKYDWHHDEIAYYLNPTLGGIPVDPGEPDYIAIYARSFLYMFMDGDDDAIRGDMKPTTIGQSQMDAFQQATANSSCFSEWLTHNSGAAFSDQGVANIPQRDWDDESRVAQFFALRTPLALETITIPLGGGYIESQTATGASLEQFYDNQVKAAAEALLQNEPVGSSVTMPQGGGFYHFPNQNCNLFSSESPSWVPAATIRVGEGDAYGGKWGAFLGQYVGGTDSFDEYDAAGTIGRGRILDPRCQITVKKVQKGIWPVTWIEYEVISVNLVCELEDLYDFNYEDSELASHAAAHQVGYGNGNNGRNQGFIYRDKILIDHTYNDPFDQLYIPPPPP